MVCRDAQKGLKYSHVAHIGTHLYKANVEHCIRWNGPVFVYYMKSLSYKKTATIEILKPSFETGPGSDFHPAGMRVSVCC